MYIRICVWYQDITIRTAYSLYQVRSRNYGELYSLCCHYFETHRSEGKSTRSTYLAVDERSVGQLHAPGESARGLGGPHILTGHIYQSVCCMQPTLICNVTIFKLRLIFQTEKGLKQKCYVCIRDKIELFVALLKHVQKLQKLFHASRKLALA